MVLLHLKLAASCDKTNSFIYLNFILVAIEEAKKKLFDVNREDFCIQICSVISFMPRSGKNSFHLFLLSMFSSFAWECFNITDDGKYGKSCFHSNTNNTMCKVAMEEPVLRFPGTCLVPAYKYIFNLTVYAAGRQSSSVFQTIKVLREPEEVLE